MICGDNTKSVDDTIRALIEEWLVPALVEEYIRLHQRNHRDDNADSPKTEPALIASSTTAGTEKLQSDCGADGGIRR